MATILERPYLCANIWARAIQYEYCTTVNSHDGLWVVDESCRVVSCRSDDGLMTDSGCVGLF